MAAEQVMVPPRNSRSGSQRHNNNIRLDENGNSSGVQKRNSEHLLDYAMQQAKDVLSSATEFFQGDPLQTQIGQRIEWATDGTLPTENWELNLQICDMFNHSEEFIRDGVRALKRRLQTQVGKNNACVLYSLTLLETIVKNGNRKVHAALMDKDFIQALVVLIGPKYDPPQAVQEKVLGLIQTWSDAFASEPALQGVCQVHAELKAKGVEFPMTDLDSMAPIMTPKKTVSGGGASGGAGASGGQQAAQQRVTSGPVHCTPEQLAKLRSELDIVNGNMRVLREMLSELVPGAEAADDYELLVQLHDTCRHMQQRCLHLLQVVANEEVTNELLLINDEMNNTFEKYERYMQNRQQNNTGGSSSAAAASASTANEPSLIDLSDSSGVPTSQLANLNVTAAASGGTQPKEQQQPAEFDMFAQSRGTTFEQSRKGGSSYADNSTSLDQIDVSLGTVAQKKAAGADLSPSKETAGDTAATASQPNAAAKANENDEL